jgi:hypothetical protein
VSVRAASARGSFSVAAVLFRLSASGDLICRRECRADPGPRVAFHDCTALGRQQGSRLMPGTEAADLLDEPPRLLSRKVVAPGLKTEPLDGNREPRSSRWAGSVLGVKGHRCVDQWG